MAINAEYAADPTMGQAVAVNDRLPSGMAFVGVGLIRTGDRSYYFERTKAPGDLS